ncbi:TerC family protein [Georgenia sp. Z1344]|uniref:TerC family protein n=1 Tax=Georgenia sp. Z1344 TaxID=3416706 RepID=UPI003CFAD908
MDVHAIAWIGLAAVILTMITIDIVGHVRTPHEPTLKEAAWWSVAYIAMGVAFGFVVWYFWGSGFAGEYFAGYVTEKSLSIDNLFVFVIIIAGFRVPRKYQQEALLVGIIIALVLRLVFILIGAALVERFVWIFFIFGAFLLYTAISQARQGVEKPGDDEEYQENWFIRFTRRILPVTDGFEGGKLIARHGGKTFITPLLLCIIALGAADVMFAVDSIPAIFGITQEAYLVFAANAFSLLGLRQLYFLIDGLLDRLVYLHYGLAAILGFIAIKLLIHAFHGYEMLEAIPEPSIAFSLSFIVVALVITVVASLAKSRKLQAEGRTAEDPLANGSHHSDES